VLLTILKVVALVVQF